MASLCVVVVVAAKLHGKRHQMINSQSRHPTPNPRDPRRTRDAACMASWTAASRHISGTHMGGKGSPEANTQSCRKRTLKKKIKKKNNEKRKKKKTQKTRTRAESEMSLTLCLDERFCNLSFGCLNSFVFICPGSQKNLTVNHSVTPWARWAEVAGRRFTHLTSPGPGSRG